MTPRLFATGGAVLGADPWADLRAVLGAGPDRPTLREAKPPHTDRFAVAHQSATRWRERLKLHRRVAGGAACARRRTVQFMRSLLPFTHEANGLRAVKAARGARSRDLLRRRLHTEIKDLRFARIDGYMDCPQPAAGEEVRT